MPYTYIQSKKLREHLTIKENKIDSVRLVSETSKERLKSSVFSCLVKTDIDGDATMSGGRPFQTRAAETTKARSR